MKKAMFHKFTNFIQQTVDAFSPNIAPHEEFVYHWKSVTSYFLDNKDGGVRIEETALPEHLMAMLRILQEEESNYGEAGTTGACLEYLLQHKLLETLYTLGRTDHPPGMKQLVLSFFTKALSRISHPLLPHINVHRAIQQMVKACGESRAAPTEKEEIEFLCTVCAKIKTDPYLVNFFIENVRRPSDFGVVTPTPQSSQTFSLVDALLTLSHSEDARISVKACEGLMLCASLPEHSAAKALIHQTQFCQTLASMLFESFKKLPSAITPDDIMNTEAKWGFDDVLERNDQNSFPGKQRLISFLSWLDYCDQLIAVSNPAVGEALAAEVHKQLLTDHFQAQLMQPSESGAIVATFYMNRCLRTVNSPSLLKEFCLFLFGEDRSVELRDSPHYHPLHKRLIERCNHVSEEVCLATLKLFDTLLQKEEEHIYHCLVIRNLLGRSYLNTDTLLEPAQNSSHKSDLDPARMSVSNTQQNQEQDHQNHQQSSKTEVQDTDSDTGNQEKQVSKETSDQSTPSLSPSDDLLQERLECTETCDDPNSERENSIGTNKKPALFGPTEVHKVVNCFLSLLPEETKSSYQTSDTGYDMYLRDAHKQFFIHKTVCRTWGWPISPLEEIDFKTQPFFEGSFLHMLVEKLSHLLDQSYSVNLLLTALISRVALVPHPNLHEFLLEPFLPAAKGTRTLYSVLNKVANDIKHHLNTDPTFFQKLLMARKQLFGLVPTIHSLRKNATKPGQQCDGSGFEDQGRMEAIIVLEEFCKELSAITFVKHHAAVTQV